jgi:hypothetical protein
VRVDDRGVLDVDPQAVMGVSTGLRHRAVVVAAQRRVCEQIDVVGADPSIGSRLAAFTSVWGSAAAALARELDLLGVELGKSACAVVHSFLGRSSGRFRHQRGPRTTGPRLSRSLSRLFASDLSARVLRSCCGPLCTRPVATSEVAGREARAEARIVVPGWRAVRGSLT